MLKSISSAPGAGGPATSINPGVPIGNVTPGSGAFTTLASNDQTNLAINATAGFSVRTDKILVNASTGRVGIAAGAAPLGVFSVGDASAVTNFQSGLVALALPVGSGSWIEFVDNSVNGTAFRISKDSSTGIVLNSNVRDIGLRSATYGTTIAGSQFVLKTSGKIGIGGIVSPTAGFHIGAGVAAAGGSPFKLTSGPLLTVTEAGAEEFLTNDRYYTGTDGTRRRYAVNSQVITFIGFTVAGLPAGSQGNKAFVTDALAPTYLAGVVGGGSVVTEVFHNGTAWVCT